MKKKISLALSALLLGVLTACGGGGGGDGSAAPGASAQVQGRWTTTTGSNPAYTAIGLPASSASAPVWLLANDATRLLKLTAQDNGTLTGKAYTLGQTSAAAAINGQWSTSASTSKSLMLSGLPGGALTLAQTDPLTAASVQADVAGTWKATAGGNAQTVSWTVAASGAVSGSSTTGCTYTGTLTAMGNASAYTAAFRETCSDGASTQFNGIATLNSTKNALSVVATSADESVGAALFLSK